MTLLARNEKKREEMKRKDNAFWLFIGFRGKHYRIPPLLARLGRRLQQSQKENKAKYELLFSSSSSLRKSRVVVDSYSLQSTLRRTLSVVDQSFSSSFHSFGRSVGRSDVVSTCLKIHHGRSLGPFHPLFTWRRRTGELKKWTSLLAVKRVGVTQSVISAVKKIKINLWDDTRWDETLWRISNK